MIFKKVFIVASAIIGMGMSLQSTAQEVPPLPIYPQSGEYLDVQEFDITLGLPQELPPQVFVANSPYQIVASINGIDMTNWLRQCTDQYRTTVTGTNYLLCKKQNSTAFTKEINELTIAILKDSTVIYKGNAFYRVQKSQRIYQSLPHSLTLPGNSVHREASIRLMAGQRVLITATGQVSTWPANTSFPISTPKGNGTTCNVGHCTFPGGPQGALLVKIGVDGNWVLIGDNKIFTAYRTGDLIFGINDKQTPAELNDNIGSYDITVKPY